jgi:asparagine synthase (glutamine-hydrolysing)
MLMANSVEGRFPFLDRDVVDFANQLPARHKLFGLEEKYLLKRAFADVVPDQILRRPKQPYRAPDAASFFAPGRPEWFDEVTSERAVKAAGVFEPALVSGLFAKCAKSGGEKMSNTDNMRVLAIVSTQLTYESFVAHDEWGDVQRALPEPAVAVDLIDDEGKFDD